MVLSDGAAPLHFTLLPISVGREERGAELPVDARLELASERVAVGREWAVAPSRETTRSETPRIAAASKVGAFTASAVSDAVKARWGTLTDEVRATRAPARDDRGDTRLAPPGAGVAVELHVGRRAGIRCQSRVRAGDNVAAARACLVCCDPSVDRGYFAACVSCGSLDDGPIEGLAHLAEHMTLASDPAGLASFIDGRQGEVNAFTGERTTTFYAQFDLDSERGLDVEIGDGLRRFAALFAAARSELPKKRLLRQEISRVDAEMRDILRAPSRGLVEVASLKARTEAASTWSRLGRGDATTLRAGTDAEARELAGALGALRAARYSAASTTVAIVSPLPIDAAKEFGRHRLLGGGGGAGDARRCHEPAAAAGAPRPRGEAGRRDGDGGHARLRAAAPLPRVVRRVRRPRRRRAREAARPPRPRAHRAARGLAGHGAALAWPRAARGGGRTRRRRAHGGGGGRLGDLAAGYHPRRERRAALARGGGAGDHRRLPAGAARRAELVGRGGDRGVVGGVALVVAAAHRDRARLRPSV